MEITHKKPVTAACNCNKCVNNKDELIYSIWKNKIIYFCTEKCKNEFDESPETFIKSNHFKIDFNDLPELEMTE